MGEVSLDKIVTISRDAEVHQLARKHAREGFDADDPTDALEIAQEHSERHIIVSDQEAIEQQMYLLERAKILTELAASCTLAAAYRIQAEFSEDDHVVLFLCGGNVAVDEMLTYQNLIH